MTAEAISPAKSRENGTATKKKKTAFHSSRWPSFVAFGIGVAWTLSFPLQNLFLFRQVPNVVTTTVDVTPFPGIQEYWPFIFQAMAAISEKGSAAITSFAGLTTPTVFFYNSAPSGDIANHISALNVPKGFQDYEAYANFVLLRYVANNYSLFGMSYDSGQTTYTNFRIVPEKPISTLTEMYYDTAAIPAKNYALYYQPWMKPKEAGGKAILGDRIPIIPLSSCVECVLCLVNKTVEDYFAEYLEGSGCGSKECQAQLRTSLNGLLSSPELAECRRKATLTEKVEYILDKDPRYVKAFEVSGAWAPPVTRKDFGIMNGVADLLFGSDFQASLVASSNAIDAEILFGARGYPDHPAESHPISLMSHLVSGCVWGTSSMYAKVNSDILFRPDPPSFANFTKCMIWAVKSPSVMTAVWGGYIRSTSLHVNTDANEIFTVIQDPVEVSLGTALTSAGEPNTSIVASDLLPTTSTVDLGNFVKQVMGRDLGAVKTIKIIQGQCNRTAAEADMNWGGEGVYLYSPHGFCNPIKLMSYNSRLFKYWKSCMDAGIIELDANSTADNVKNSDDIYETILLQGSQSQTKKEEFRVLRLKARMAGEFLTCTMQGWASGRPLTIVIMDVLEWGRSFRMGLATSYNGHMTVICSLFYVGLLGNLVLVGTAFRVIKRQFALLTGMKVHGIRYIIETWDTFRSVLCQLDMGTRVMMSISPASLLVYYSVSRVEALSRQMGVVYDDIDIISRLMNGEHGSFAIVWASYTLALLWVVPSASVDGSTSSPSAIRVGWVRSCLYDRIVLCGMRTLEIVYCLFVYNTISSWAGPLLASVLPFSINLSIWMCILAVIQPVYVTLVKTNMDEVIVNTASVFSKQTAVFLQKHNVCTQYIRLSSLLMSGGGGNGASMHPCVIVDLLLRRPAANYNVLLKGFRGDHISLAAYGMSSGSNVNKQKFNEKVNEIDTGGNNDNNEKDGQAPLPETSQTVHKTKMSDVSGGETKDNLTEIDATQPSLDVDEFFL